MAINQNIWKIVGNKPQEVTEITLEKERDLEEIINNDITILNPQWLLIGRQVITAFSKFIDLLAIDKNGNLIIIELKRDKTPREVIAQALDYASWVKNLEPDTVAAIYNAYDEKYLKSGKSLSEYFEERFDSQLDESNINQGHQIVIVASTLDDSTERIVQYLSDSEIPINVMFFKVFSDNGSVFISRVWMIEPEETEDHSQNISSKVPWNGEFYVSFGEGKSRNWEDAAKYGFVSAGGGLWYSQTLNYLQPNDRIWVNIPGTGYVGVGKVTSTIISARDITFLVDGKSHNIFELECKGNYHKEETADSEKGEYFVKVEWLHKVERNNAIKEIGFFGNQNTVCKPRSSKWRFTVDFLKEKWKLN